MNYTTPGNPVPTDAMQETGSSNPGSATKMDVTDYGFLMAQVLDAISDMIIVMNADGRMLFCNRAAYQFHGPGLTLAKLPHEKDCLYHQDDQGIWRTATEQVLRNGVNVKVVLRAVRYDYSPRWHAFNITPLFDKTSRAIAVLIRMTDIHDHYRPERPAGPTHCRGEGDSP
jgi:PAS domain S-box-containing protein